MPLLPPSLPRAFHGFSFLEPGPLFDRELELLTPDARHVDDLLAACHHPITQRDMPAEGNISRDDVLQFLASNPKGHHLGDASRGWLPQYTFWMRLDSRWFASPLPIRIAGSITLRVGQSPAAELYYGNVGYHVYPPARGRHYAERAVRLLLPLARRHGMRSLWITCNPDNGASKRTCERLGMEYAGILPVPPEDPLYARGEREKCRYRMEI